MGNCFQPALKSRPTSGQKTRAGHMGPDGVESSIFQGNGIDYGNPKEKTPAGSKLVPPAPPPNPNDPNEGEPPDVQLTVEMGLLDDLHDRNGAARGAPANGQGAAGGAVGGPASGEDSQTTKNPKQAVMRRSFPPVGVFLVLDRDAGSILALSTNPAQMPELVAAEMSAAMQFAKERIRVMHCQRGSNEVKLNIVADRSDQDQRSPMQLAAALVEQANNPDSNLRKQPISMCIARANIAEDPFPGTKQDSWAGGVAMLRPPSPRDGKEKKPKKNKEA
eukprot:CAMPEP_0181322158 /NCGR_PEP_ID=MMETSP1101-20121128/19078_1 /TAXON_ID=46948 /ORGANISM="Rhodomonas abbreviata, Strain Caron Lab Isolate" /LENGTH=276 /DNA_ID=CAMNT_0023430051 /DNA_START=368 /DNA_END=1195 /DNA_ORIENTATION=-